MRRFIYIFAVLAVAIQSPGLIAGHSPVAGPCTLPPGACGGDTTAVSGIDDDGNNASHNDGDDTISTDTIADSLAIDDTPLPWPQNIVARISKLLAGSMFSTSTAGIMIYDLTADSAIFTHNHRQLMRPASTLKMMVAVAALNRLGADYRYTTRLSYTGHKDSTVLRGSLYCRGGFDPALDGGDLNAMADSISAMGIDTIRGNVFADLSMKDSDLLGEGWCWDDDNPVLSPLVVGRKDNFLERFASALRRNGIVVEGSFEKARTPQQAQALCTINRHITDVLQRMMKKSDNLYAESVFYQLAADAGSHRPASARQGRQVMNRLIEHLGFRPSAYYVADGSGLSLYNYVSPELEVAFLRHAYAHQEIYQPLLASMPIAGVDGTLRSRMRSGEAHQNVRAKTGTVTGVSALAGYCTAANGHRLCFSIINMGIRHASSGRSFQDRVCQALCR